MLKPLIIEIGVEELPAIPLLKELDNISKKYMKVLEKYSLKSDFEFYYTPRRLVLWHKEFKVHQEDSVEEFFGAPLTVAFKDNKPTPAAIGFAKKCGISLDEVSSTMKNNKEVLYYKKEIKGRLSSSLLSNIVNEWIKSLNFGKSMRWGESEDGFIRPIRWVCSLFGDEIVDIELFGLMSKNETFTHRSFSFEATKFYDIKEYFSILEDAGVVLFQDKRRESILSQFEKIEKKESIKIDIDSSLLDEIVAITENPTVLMGSFDKEFLRLPKEVIITSMKEHQRYFPVFKDSKLINKFILVSNALTKDFANIIKGNERVLKPRLADGLFFLDNDIKNGLNIDELEKVIFFKGLGSLADKIKREKKISKKLFNMYGDGLSEDNLIRAITLAKADLSSEMVYEFTELQGLMGGYYANIQGENIDVCTCIKEQYLPSGDDSALPSTRLSAIVSMSIKLDTILSLFSINQIPTGSRDPFALRRAVNGIIRISKKYNFDFDIQEVLYSLSQNYKDIDIKKLKDFFIERVRQSFNFNPSIVEAILVTGELELLRIQKKANALNSISKSEDFPQYFSTFKRVSNISKDVDLSNELKVNILLFELEEEKNLYFKYITVSSKKYINYEDELDALLGMKQELDIFFEKVIVNAEDDKVRNNRKFLVASIYKSILNIADIKEITI